MLLQEIDYLVIILIIISNISTFYQAYKMYITKKVDGINITAWLISLTANICWILFSLHRKNNIILFSSSISIIGNLLIIYLKYLFSKE